MLEIKNLKVLRKKQLLFTGNISANAGEITFLYGAIGTGKSTLFHQIARHEIKILENGQIMKSTDWFSQCAMLEQDVSRYDEYTLAELKECFCFDETLSFNDVGLKYIENHKISECSQGQKQRLCLLVALWKKPHVLILDEPTAFLDTKTSANITELIQKYTLKHQCITLITSHHLDDLKFADKIYQIKNKQLECVRDTRNQKSEPLKSKFDINSLIKRIKTKVLQPWVHAVSSVLLVFCLCYLGVIYLYNATSDDFIQQDYRYFFSYEENAESLPLYYSEQTYEVNEKQIVIGIMNYYPEMNMKTQNDLKEDDIIATEVLYHLVDMQALKLKEASFEISNIMYDNTNSVLRNQRYMIFLPNNLYEKYYEKNIYGYVNVYSNENELAHLSNLTENQIFQTSSPKNTFQSFQEVTNILRMTLILSPHILGGFLIILRIVVEKKQKQQLELLCMYGMSLKKYRLFQLSYKIPIWFFSILLLVILSFNSIVSNQALMLLMYFALEIGLSLFPHLYLNFKK